MCGARASRACRRHFTVSAIVGWDEKKATALAIAYDDRADESMRLLVRRREAHDSFNDKGENNDLKERPDGVAANRTEMLGSPPRFSLEYLLQTEGDPEGFSCRI